MSSALCGWFSLYTCLWGKAKWLILDVSSLPREAPAALRFLCALTRPRPGGLTWGLLTSPSVSCSQCQRGSVPPTAPALCVPGGSSTDLRSRARCPAPLPAAGTSADSCGPASSAAASYTCPRGARPRPRGAHVSLSPGALVTTALQSSSGEPRLTRALGGRPVGSCAAFSHPMLDLVVHCGPTVAPACSGPPARVPELMQTWSCAVGEVNLSKAGTSHPSTWWDSASALPCSHTRLRMCQGWPRVASPGAALTSAGALLAHGGLGSLLDHSSRAAPPPHSSLPTCPMPWCPSLVILGRHALQCAGQTQPGFPGTPDPLLRPSSSVHCLLCAHRF